jgi:sarcosine oxidase, subunit beta
VNQLNQTESSALPSSADIVIIGAGVNGLATAFELSKRRPGRIVVLERKFIGAGASGKSGALVRQHYTNTPEARLTLESLPIFTNWSERIGFGSCGFEQPGFLRIVAPEDEPILRENVADLQEAGIRTWMVTPDEIAKLEPLLHTGDISAAAFEPDAGYADPNATMFGYAQAAKANGVEIVTDCEATAVLTEGGKVVGLATANGTIATNSVLVAAGAWADRLLSPLGLDIGMVPYKSQVVVFRHPLDVDSSRKHRVVIDTIHQSWLRPEGDNGTLIGIEFPDRKGDPDTFPQFPPPDYVHAAQKALAARFPVFENAAMRGGWTGVYMMSPDHHPIIGKMDGYDGLFVMAGDSGSSFKTAPATGICLSQLMLDGSAKLVDLHPFRPSRFAEGAPWVDARPYGKTPHELSISR